MFIFGAIIGFVGCILLARYTGLVDVFVELSKKIF